MSVTYDEPTHVSRTESWLSTGWYLPDGYLTEDEVPDPDEPRGGPYVYGPAFSVVAHAVNVVAGNEGLSEVSASRDAYEVRHLVAALVGLLGVVSVGITVSALSGSRTFGLWAAAGLMAVPAWIGQSFFSVKDVPAASGYSMLTAGLVLACCDGRDRITRFKGKVGIGLLVASGIALGVGTRPSFLIPFAISVALFGFLRLARSRADAWRGDGGAAFSVVMGCLIGLLFIVVLYYQAFEQPWELVVRSLFDATDYAWEGVTLTAGELLTERPPWWYLPAWILGTYPIALMILAFIGALAMARQLSLRVAGASAWTAMWTRREIGVSIVLLQAVLVTSGAAARGAVMYTGIRQHLYVVPAIAVFAGLGAHSAWRWAGSHKWSLGFLRPILFIALTFALALPVIDQLRLFPYNYVYVNEIAGMGGITSRWETDYYVASSAEALSHVPKDVELRCSDRLVRTWLPTDPRYSKCTGPRWDPIGDARGTDVSPHADRRQGEIWVIGRNRGGNAPPDFCVEAHHVVRRLRGEDVVMSYVLRCDGAALRAAVHGGGTHTASSLSQ